MNANDAASLLIEIKPWQENLYDQMRRPETVTSVKRKLQAAQRDLDTARRAGDDAAVQGVQKAFQLFLLELIAVDVTTERDRQKKHALLERWSSIASTSPLLGVALQTAVASGGEHPSSAARST